MGNSASKPAGGSRQCSTSSTTPLNANVSDPTTPTPLLTSFPQYNGVYSPDDPCSSPEPTPSRSTPSTFATATSPYPDCPTPAVREITVTGFAGDSPPNSRPVSRFPYPPSANRTPIDFESTSTISRPTNARPAVRRLSELIDPMMLVSDDEKAVRSPSGNLLGRQSFEEREDRPLSMRERQERVRQQVLLLQQSRASSQQYSVASHDMKQDPEKMGEGSGKKEAKKNKGCCSCFCC